MGYLVTVLVWALFVAVALRPPFRGGTAGFVVFVMAMTMNEVPLVMMVVFLASIGLLLPEVATDIPGATNNAGSAPTRSPGIVLLRECSRPLDVTLHMVVK